MKFLLFFGMDWCEARPNLMLAAVTVCIVLCLIVAYPN